MKGNYKNIIHISDIHIRHEVDREKEYESVFDKLFSRLKEEIKKEKTIIFLTGDLIHTKNKITPIVLHLIVKLVYGLSEIGDLVIMDGNHDICVGDEDEKTLLKVIKMPDNVTYIDRTGEYVFGNITTGISTLNDNKFITYEEINKKDNDIVVALGHYSLLEYFQERNITAYARLKTVDDFAGYEYALLGDIHCRKSYKNCRYAGSLIQQNHGESPKSHGFSLYSMKTKKWRKINIQSDYSFIDLHIDKDGELDINDTDFTKNSYVKLHMDNKFIDFEKDYKILIQNKTNILRFQRQINGKHDISKDQNDFNIECKEIKDIGLSEKDIIISLIPKCVNSDKIIDLHNKFKSDNFNYKQNRTTWSIRKLEFENILKYKGKHNINFNDLNGIIGITGLNASGKSSLLKIIIFGLSGDINVNFSQVNSDHTKVSQTYNHYKFETINILNYDNSTKRGSMEIQIIHNDTIYKIRRHLERRGTSISTNSTLSTFNDDEKRWDIICSSEMKHKGKILEKDVNKQIYNMIGRSSDLIIMNVINKFSGSITEITDVARFNLLSNIFNLSVYNDIHLKVKNKLSEVRDEIIKYKDRKEQSCDKNKDLEKINIDEINKEIRKYTTERSILNKLKNNTIKLTDEPPTLISKGAIDLKNTFDNTILLRDKNSKNIFADIPEGITVKPPINVTRASILKIYSDVSNAKKIDEYIPDIDDLPEPYKTNVTQKEVDKLNKLLSSYGYDIDEIIDKEDEYKKILIKFDKNIDNVESTTKMIKLDCNFDIDPNTETITMDQSTLKNSNPTELNKEKDKIKITPLKHINSPKEIKDNKNDLQEIIDTSFEKIHNFTKIDDIIDSLKKGKLKQSHISRLEKIPELDNVIMEISGDVSNALERKSQLLSDIQYNKQIDEDIKYNETSKENQRRYDKITKLLEEKRKYDKNMKINKLNPYFTELNRRLTYIELYKKYTTRKKQYLQHLSYLKSEKERYSKKIEYESYLRYYDQKARECIKDFNKTFSDINYTVDTKVEKLDKIILDLRNKIIAKDSVTKCNRSLKELNDEMETLTVYNKLVRDDIKVSILSKYVEQISDHINDFLNNLVTFTIEFSLVTDTSDKTNKLKISIIRNKSVGAYSLSQYEEFVLNLITKVVLNSFSSNSTSSFLILDECLECIDSVNKHKIEHLFKFLKQKYKHIMLITHIVEYFEICDKKINVIDGSLSVM